MNLYSLPVTQFLSQPLGMTISSKPRKDGGLPSSQYLSHTNVLTQFCVSLSAGLSFSRVKNLTNALSSSIYSVC